ncbi:MAG TPA: AI-2E family transporter [Geobacteraceae bacterium]
MAGQRLVPALLVMAALIAAGYAIRHTFSCFLLSFIIAYLLDPIVTVLERRRIPRIRGIILLYIVLGIFSIFFAIYLVPLINLRWAALLHSLPLYLQKVKEITKGWEGQFEPLFASEEWRWFLDNAVGSMDSLVARIGSVAYAAVTRVVFNIFNLILSPILVFFMLYYKGEIKSGIVSWLPPSRRDAIIDMGRELNANIGGYLKGQLIVSLIVAVLATAALFYLNVDYPLLNGIFAGAASVLPFVGVILATIPPLFFAYIKFQSGIVLLKVVAAFAVIYFLEGYLVKPLVFKGAMDLNPLATIITIMAFGELLGFWGILLAIPIAAAVKIFVSRFQRGDFASGG